MSIFADSDSAQQHTDDDAPSRLSTAAVIGWGAALVLTAVAVVVAIWQVNEQLYSPEHTAEQHWQSLSEAEGAEVLDRFHEPPDLLADEQTDHLLLDGGALARSAELIESPQVSATPTAAQMQFTVGSDSYTSEVPLTHAGTTWGFFDEWELATNAATWFEVEVPGAPEGGIGQVQVNGEPVNLDDDTARLSAFVPSAAEFAVESQWLIGSASHVVTAPAQNQDSAERVTVDLQASDEAVELLHTEVSQFFEHCDQQVLMPAGCPVGMTTPHRVEAETISWSFPDPESFSLGFDADGWQVSHDELVAEVSFEATHHHTGERLTQTDEVPFSLDVQVGADGEELIVSVSSGS